MKRIIFILWAVLASSGWLMANHWTPNSTPYEDNMTLTGFVRIDGDEQWTTALEVGAFCGEECRGSARLTFFEPSYRYVVQLVIYGNVGDQITFRLFDHDQNEELDLISYDEVTFASDGYGSLADPYMLNFYSEPPGPHTISVWANPEEGGIVTGGGVYNHGDTVTLSATANENYVFSYWEKDGWIFSESETFNVVVIESSNYVAYFDLDITPHWTPNNISSYADNMTLTGVIQINGQEQQNPMLEVGVFCGEECRGSGTLAFFEPAQRYVVQLVAYGNDGDMLTFKLYDHSQNEELDLYCATAITFSPYGYGTLAEPYVLNFTETATDIHTVTAEINLAGSGTVTGTGVYLHGSTCTLEAEPNEGYEFINWTENGEMASVSSSYAFEVTSDRNVMANFVPIESNHWTPNMAIYEDNMTLTGTVEINAVEQQTTALEVGVFCGEECRGSGRLSFFAPSQRYVIQLVIYGNYGDQLTFKLFDHVQNEELDLVAPEAITLDEYGYGTLANPYVLSFLEIFEISAVTNPTESGTVTGMGTYEYSSTCTLTATANTGYHFANWTLDGEVVSTQATYSFTVTGAAEYVANFELNSYNIITMVNPTTGGTVTGAGSYEHFSTCTLTATANTGYHFLNWTQNGTVVSTEQTYSFEVTGAAFYVANFELNSYEIMATVNPTESGAVTGAGTYEYSSTCTLTATANTGYHFANWTLDGEVVSTQAIYSFTVTGAAEYVANFELNSYNIITMVNPTTGGTVTGAGSYEHFSTCTLTATANTGYHFLNWTQNGTVVSTDSTYSFEVTGAAFYVANFELNSYEITATVNPIESGTAEGSGTYEHFSSCTLTATPNQGYAFLNWTKDGQEVSTNPTYSFTVTEAAALVANFELTAITQSDGFSQGWNWWSTYVEADDLLEQMENSLGTHGVTVKSQNGYVQYMPDFNIWYGSPGFGVYNEYCYLIQTTADCDVEVTGAQASPTNHPITLSFGWNWIGFPCTAHQSFETAFSGIVPRDGDIVKSQTQGFASYMSAFNIWYGTLADYGIDPGMGLLYRSFNGETFTFTYPESRGDEPAGNDFTENNHWKANYHAYPNNMTVIAIVELGDVEINSENYELAAFANGKCRGSVRLMHVAPINRYMAFLTVAGDEASELRFSLYDIETGTVETECLTTLQYETDATIGSFESPYVVRFRNTTGVDELGNRFNVFPNPVAKGEKVNIDLKADNLGKMRVEIVNALGMVVETQGLASPQTIHAPNTAGVYTLRITVDGEGTYCRKLVVR